MALHEHGTTVHGNGSPWHQHGTAMDGHGGPCTTLVHHGMTMARGMTMACP